MIRVASPDLGQRELDGVARVLASGQLVQGKCVEHFEALIAERVGVKHAIAVSSGTAALHLALIALDIEPGDEVILPDFTFPATANVVAQVGASPRLVDVRLDTFNIDPEKIEAAIGPRTRAIIPVHLFGLSADMTAIGGIAKRHKLSMIEDAACALGALHLGRPCGSLGDVGCFSFHPRKVITTGEGGVLTTDDGAIARRLRRLRNHGLEDSGGASRVIEPGLNYRLTEIQAAIGIAQMERLDEFLEIRRSIAGWYGKALGRFADLTPPRQDSKAEDHTFQSFVVLLDPKFSRDAVMSSLRQRGVETAIGTYSVSAQPHYARYRARAPNSRTAYARAFSLPMHARLTESDLETVVEALGQALQSCVR